MMQSEVEELLPEDDSNPVMVLADAQVHIAKSIDKCRKLIDE